MDDTLFGFPIVVNDDVPAIDPESVTIERPLSMQAVRYHRDDPCPTGCGGYLGIRTTKPPTNGLCTRYFRCRKCSHTVSCEVPADSVPARATRQR